MYATAYCQSKWYLRRYADLPTTGNKKGDVWNIVNADAAHGGQRR